MRIWMKLPVRDRVDLMRSYRENGMSYKEAVKDFEEYTKSPKYKMGGKLPKYGEGGNIKYGTPEYKKRYEEGTVMNYIPEKDLHVAPQLDPFTVTAKDTRGGDVVRDATRRFVKGVGEGVVEAALGSIPRTSPVGLFLRKRLKDTRVSRSQFNPKQDILLNENPEAAWIQNWTNNRRKQLYNNIDEYENLFRLGTKAQTLYDLSYRPEKAADREVRKQTGNIDDVDFYTDHRKFQDKTGSRVPRDSWWQPYPVYSRWDHAIYMPRGRVGTIAEIHERSHSARAYPQEHAISKILEDEKSSIEKIIENNPTLKREDDYYYKPTEVYSRLMEERWRLKLNPNDTITLDKIKEYRKDSGSRDLFQMFDDETLKRLFNEVADINIEHPLEYTPDQLPMT